MRNNAFHSTYLRDRVGHATITSTEPCEAGSFASFTLTYTAGYFGIDDTGSLKIASRLATRPPLALRLIKEVALAGSDAPLATGLLLERRAFELLFDTADQKEGMRAFVERRNPVFIGE